MDAVEWIWVLWPRRDRLRARRRVQFAVVLGATQVAAGNDCWAAVQLTTPVVRPVNRLCLSGESVSVCRMSVSDAELYLMTCTRAASQSCCCCWYWRASLCGVVLPFTWLPPSLSLALSLSLSDVVKFALPDVSSSLYIALHRPNFQTKVKVKLREGSTSAARTNWQTAWNFELWYTVVILAVMLCWAMQPTRL